MIWSFPMPLSNGSPNHYKLIQKIHGMLSREGRVAIQVPLFWDMPLGRIIRGTAEKERWRKQTVGVSDLFTIHAYAFYFDCLSDFFFHDRHVEDPIIFMCWRITKPSWK